MGRENGAVFNPTVSCVAREVVGCAARNPPYWFAPLLEVAPALFGEGDGLARDVLDGDIWFAGGEGADFVDGDVAAGG